MMYSVLPVFSAVLSLSAAFTHSRAFLRPTTLLKAGESKIETIEFRIFPDGRVEEVVRGVKGVNCNKVTDEINAALGKVIDTRPTEEMYETELKIDNVVQITDSSSDWEGSSTW
jgi:hypothetical protein